MEDHKITLRWDASGAKVTNNPTKTRLHVDDKVKFVAEPSNGKVLIVFPNGSPFSDKRPHFILGDGEQTVLKAAETAATPTFKFLCAVIDGGVVRSGDGDEIPRPPRK